MSEIADILDRAADRLAPKGAWTQGAGARDVNGLPTWLEDPKAVCWCVFTAISRASSNEMGRASRARNFLRAVTSVAFIAEWNDTPGRTQEEVVAKLREAAAKARGEPS